MYCRLTSLFIKAQVGRSIPSSIRLHAWHSFERHQKFVQVLTVNSNPKSHGLLLPRTTTLRTRSNGSQAYTITTVSRRYLESFYNGRSGCTIMVKWIVTPTTVDPAETTVLLYDLEYPWIRLHIVTCAHAKFYTKRVQRQSKKGAQTTSARSNKS